MRTRTIAVLSTITLALAIPSLHARQRAPRPNLEGTWNASTRTPFERPEAFRDRSEFTPAELAEWERTAVARITRRLRTDADRQTQIDVDDTFVEVEAFKPAGRRTSLIVDPPNGRLPPLLPAAVARVAARPKRSYDDPEAVTLGERCLAGTFGLGGSSASPPIVPSEVLPWFYQIVQTDAYVLLYTEWIHDARIIRMNGAHLPSSVRNWLGDSIGRYDGDTLVVDTTNFRSDTHNLDSSDRLHVIERFSRADAKTLRYRVTVDDPDTWATSWTAEWPFRASDAKLFGAECHEGNHAIENFLRGARAEERRAPSARQ